MNPINKLSFANYNQVNNGNKIGQYVKNSTDALFENFVSTKKGSLVGKEEDNSSLKNLLKSFGKLIAKKVDFGRIFDDVIPVPVEPKKPVEIMSNKFSALM